MARASGQRPPEDFERLARSVRQKLGIDDQVQPNLLDVIQRLKRQGYIASYVSVPDESMPHAEAKFSSKERRLSLRQSTLDALKKGNLRARWTVAHELGHVVLEHQGTNHRASSVHKIGLRVRALESEASRFAAAFLAPYHLTEFSPDTTEHHIASRFGISTAAARIRLVEIRQRNALPSAVRFGEVTAPSLSPPSGEALYSAMRQSLEQDHFGSYVMINTDTGEHVIAATTSQVHAEFIDRFGEDAPGWCTRIGSSVFVTA